MPKILYIVSTLKRSGPIVQIFNIVNNIDPNDFEISAITLSPEDDDTMIEDFKKLNIDIRFLSLSRIQGLIKGKTKLMGMVKEINPDILHTQGFRADSYSLALANDYQLVSSMQNYPFFDYPMKFGLIKGGLMAHKQLSIIKKRKNFIACSKSVADLFRENKNIIIDSIQNGVDTNYFHPIEVEKKLRLKRKLNLPEDKHIFISVGSLIPRKDMTTVIKAYKQSFLKDTLLLIAGDGVEREELNILTANNNIQFLGNVPNVKEYLQTSDFFVSASLAEGLPNTVLEAMACGIPVILSNISPHQELFTETGNYKYFFKTNNHQKLSELYKTIVYDDYKSLSTKMKNTIDQNFSAQVMSKKYQDLYRRILNDK